MPSINRSTTLPYLIFLGSWLSFYYNGILDKVVINVKLFPAWLVFLSVALFISYFGKGIKWVTFKSFDVAFLFLFVVLLPSIYENFGAYSFSIVSIVACVMLSARCGPRWHMNKKQIQFIVDIGLITAVFAVAMFIYFSYFNRPSWGESAIRPGYGYAIDRGVLLRLVGFADDPNFYVIGSTLPLLLAFHNSAVKRRNLTISVVLLSMVLTFSRSGLFSVVACFAALYFLRLKVSHAKVILPVLLLILPLFFVATTSFDSLKTNEAAEVDRGIISGLLSRSNLIVLLLEQRDIVFFGNGLGVSKELIGLHSHNTFFDFLFEGGVLPFLAFLAMTLSYIAFAFCRPNVIAAYGVGVIVGSLAVSIAFQPLLILVMLMGPKYVD